VAAELKRFESTHHFGHPPASYFLNSRISDKQKLAPEADFGKMYRSRGDFFGNDFCSWLW
jgi:hypothetical protein